MKFYRVITLAVIAAISVTFISCSDDDDNGNGPIPGSESVLPISITMTSTDEEASETISFRYNETGNDTTSIVGYSRSYGSNVVANYEVEYDNKQVTAVKFNGEILYTYETVVPAATGNAPKLIVKKDAQGNEMAYISVNSDNNIVSYSEDPEVALNREVTTYSYSGKNISKETYNFAEETVTTTYSYNSNNGIFKNVTTPQWFIVTELGDDSILTGQIHNCVNRATASFDGKTESITVNYQSVIKNFPTKFSYTYKDIDEDTGATENITESYAVTYNVAR